MVLQIKVILAKENCCEEMLVLQKFALQLLNISCLHFGVSRFARGHFYPRAGS